MEPEQYFIIAILKSQICILSGLYDDIEDAREIYNSFREGFKELHICKTCYGY